MPVRVMEMSEQIPSRRFEKFSVAHVIPEWEEVCKHVAALPDGRTQRFEITFSEQSLKRMNVKHPCQTFFYAMQSKFPLVDFERKSRKTSLFLYATKRHKALGFRVGAVERSNCL